MKQNQSFNLGGSLIPSAITVDQGAISALEEGLAHELEDFVKIELAAEQMLDEKAQVMIDYVANDAKIFWQDLKGEVSVLELAAGKLLLSAADPTSLEWQSSQWWSDKQSPHD